MSFYKYTEIINEYLNDNIINYSINYIIFKNKSDAIDFSFTNYKQYLDNYDDDINDTEYNSEGTYKISHIDEENKIEYQYSCLGIIYLCHTWRQCWILVW